MNDLPLMFSRPYLGLIGHRGVASLAPENTLESFQKAIDLKLNCIEFDIQMSQDQALWVFHDDDLKRTSNGRGLLAHHHSHELRSLDVGAWFTPSFNGAQIPSVQQVLSLGDENDISFNAELKVYQDAPRAYRESLAQSLATCIDQHFRRLTPKILVSSFCWDTLDHFRTQLPSCPVGYLCHRPEPRVLTHLHTHPGGFIHCDHTELTPQMIKACLNASIPLLVYTVNDLNTAIELISQGVFALFSDCPQNFISNSDYIEAFFNSSSIHAIR